MNKSPPDKSVQPYTVNDYIHAATRENTRKSYRAAVEHFEVKFGGRLPTTPDGITRYLATYASSLSPNTLKARLSALAAWHKAQGFVDPTANEQVKKLMKGIRAVHGNAPKQAQPVMLDHLKRVDDVLFNDITSAEQAGDYPTLLRASRNRSLVLLGFWRGFRSDELTRLRIDAIEVSPGQGMSLYLPFSKGDRANQGETYSVPALETLCPVKAYCEYLNIAELSEGPVYRKIDRWGRLQQRRLSAGSIPALLRRIFTHAGIKEAEAYSSHSLRRGFAQWADSQGWSLQEMMQYVGWKDTSSALRYMRNIRAFDQCRMT